ncbi:EV envelope glycoprotein [Cotia virus SPAn232]|uniref:Protein OPG161 n=2 Tax=Cotia virus TaxID=39444 RepID=H6TAA9_9POXV|nr:EV envelope glycoprotein [Cotia virus SPAn232]AFB76943.1 EV envelope glycoprotein [Cotia virus SPAn232]AIT70755.1 EV envelope glycoprotein [Cotia virus]
MSLVDVDIDEKNEYEYDGNTNLFNGSTIYTKNKNKKYLNIKTLLFLRIIIILSVLTLLGTTTYMIIKYNECSSSLNIDTPTVSKIVSCKDGDKIMVQCNGIIHNNDCYVLNKESTLNDAIEECNKTNSTLPSKELLTTWIGDYILDTWGSDGKAIVKYNIHLNDDFTDIEKRKYFCLKSIY